MLKYTALLTGLLIGLAGCSTNVESNPPRTATEELLISTAAEHAAEKIAVQLPPHAAIFIDNSNFEGTDSKYAMGTIRTALFKQGMRLVDDKKKADVIIETRAGALSIDRNTFLIGIPSFNVPIPFTQSPLAFPQIALYGEEVQKGVAKFAVTGYDAKKGTLVSAQDPQYGFAHKTEKTVMIFVSWTDSNTLPKGVEEEDDETKEPAEAPHPEAPLPTK